LRTPQQLGRPADGHDGDVTSSSKAWSTLLDVSVDDTDYLGHITAFVHLKLFEQARARWLAAVMEDPSPAFVLAHQELDYRREILVSDGPVTVTIEPVQLARSSVRIFEQLLAVDGTLRTESTAVLVRWDRERRRSTPFSALERQRIQAQLPTPVETI
jgi:acyl-CoA thioester hydrolase